LQRCQVALLPIVSHTLVKPNRLRTAGLTQAFADFTGRLRKTGCRVFLVEKGLGKSAEIMKVLGCAVPVRCQP
jgi:hypothetical protein